MTDREFELNETAYHILKLCRSDSSISDIKTEMETYYKCKNSSVGDTVSAFLNQVNSQFLINYKIKKNINIISYLFCKFKLIFKQCRYAIHGDNLVTIILQMLIIVFRRFFIYFFVCSLVLLITILFAITVDIDLYSDLLMLLFYYTNIFFLAFLQG